MSKRVKQLEIDVLTEEMREVQNCVILGYKGLTAEDAVALRRRLRENRVRLRIVKNSMARRAFQEAKVEGLESFLDMETAIAIGEDPIAGPKLLAEWKKENAVLDLRGGLVEGSLVDAAGIQEIAAIPSKEALLSRLLGSIQAPGNGLASVVTGLQRKLVYGLQALVEKKEADGS